MRPSSRSDGARHRGSGSGWSCRWTAACALAALIGQLAISGRAQNPAQFEPEIRTFELADERNPPPENPVLFVGSSSIRVWSGIQAAFPAYPVLNRGFGGSQMGDVIHYFDRIIVRYSPAIVFLYEGDNDLASGKSVRAVHDEYVRFFGLMRRHLPGVRVAIMAVKPSPSRSAFLAATRQLNSRLRRLAEAEDAIYVDVFSPLLNDAGEPRPDLFQSDRLHLNAAGYEMWQPPIQEALDVWADKRRRTCLIDFGPEATATARGLPPNDPVHYWNNVSEEFAGTGTGSWLSLIAADNSPTDLRLGIVHPFDGAGGAENEGSDDSGRFPVNAARDAVFSRFTSGPVLDGNAPALALSGLDPAVGYRLTFFASGDVTASSSASRYRVAGANVVFAVPGGDGREGLAAVVDGVQPTESGTVRVRILPNAANSTDSDAGTDSIVFLGVMKVEPGTLPPRIRPPVLEDGSISLDWIGGGQLQSAPHPGGPWATVTAAPPHSEVVRRGARVFFRLLK